MLRPRPVPPKRRVRRRIGLARTVGTASAARLGAMPMPVSTHVEAQPHAGPRRRAATRDARRRRCPARGELHRVADEVDEDLAQAHADRRGRARARRRRRSLRAAGRRGLPARRSPAQADVLRRARATTGGADRRVRARPASIFEKSSMSLSDAQQSAAPNRGQVSSDAALAHRRAGVSTQQFEHADHAVHGRADLVAHHRDEVGLRIRGLARFAVRSVRARALVRGGRCRRSRRPRRKGRRRRRSASRDRRTSASRPARPGNRNSINSSGMPARTRSARSYDGATSSGCISANVCAVFVWSAGRPAIARPSSVMCTSSVRMSQVHTTSRATFIAYSSRRRSNSRGHGSVLGCVPTTRAMRRILGMPGQSSPGVHVAAPRLSGRRVRLRQPREASCDKRCTATEAVG